MGDNQWRETVEWSLGRVKRAFPSDRQESTSHTSCLISCRENSESKTALLLSDLLGRSTKAGTYS